MMRGSEAPIVRSAAPYASFVATTSPGDHEGSLSDAAGDAAPRPDTGAHVFEWELPFEFTPDPGFVGVDMWLWIEHGWTVGSMTRRRYGAL
jgi:hypothetical protein